MKILFQGRLDLLTRGGGDTTQALMTADSLRRLGVQVDICTERALDVSAYDLVHLFNSTGVEFLFDQLRNAHLQSKPVALSTIYWNQDELLTARLAFGKAKRLGRLLGKRLGSWVRRRVWYAQRGWKVTRDLVRAADLLLPNSRAEEKVLYRDFDLAQGRHICAVVNGIDPTGFVGADRQPFVDRFRVQDFILSVGRIEIRKNQLALLQVLRREDPPMVLIGEPNGLEPEYAEKVHQEARERGVRIIERLPHAELGSAYAAARVHILPSWYETPGLASLEAGVAGCPVVTTDRGCTREYFGTLVEYCDPSKPESIRAALDRALSSPRTDSLRKQLLAKFTWERAARQTIDAYQSLVS